MGRQKRNEEREGESAENERASAPNEALLSVANETKRECREGFEEATLPLWSLKRDRCFGFVQLVLGP